MQTITETQLYWLTRLDSIRGVLCWVIFIMFATAFAHFIFAIIEGGEAEFSSEVNHAERMVRTVLIRSALFVAMAIATMFARAMLPTTKEMAAIVVVPKIANSQSVQEIGGEIVTLAKEWLTELHPKKK